MTTDLLAADVTRVVIEPIDTFVHRDRIVLINEMQRLRRPNSLAYEHVAAHRREPRIPAVRPRPGATS